MGDKGYFKVPNCPQKGKNVMDTHSLPHNDKQEHEFDVRGALTLAVKEVVKKGAVPLPDSPPEEKTILRSFFGQPVIDQIE